MLIQKSRARFLLYTSTSKGYRADSAVTSGTRVESFLKVNNGQDKIETGILLQFHRPALDCRKPL